MSSRGGAGSGFFCALWQSAAQDWSALRALAQSGEAEAYALFSDFQEKGYDSDYWGGVAAFHAFQQAYTSLTDGTDKTANRPLCSAVYGGLLITPERAREHLPEILDAMRFNKNKPAQNHLTRNIPPETSHIFRGAHAYNKLQSVFCGGVYTAKNTLRWPRPRGPVLGRPDG